MNTPIADFVRAYAASGCARLHMPGHKGRPFLGCEALDITEIAGADELYGAAGIIAQSEKNAGALFGSGRTFYAAEGSSQCVRAMLALAVWSAPPGRRPVVLAARNAHKSLLYAAALLDFDVAWLWPESPGQSLCACPVSPAALERALEETRPAAVYVTSPDYLGGACDVAALAAVSHRRGVPLLVDNAHGAYLRFLNPSRHPLDLGAAVCCDSAHKTLPVLTGGAYLHIGKDAPASFAENARASMELFGSTSPSYLTLASLDLCSRYLAEGYAGRLAAAAEELAELRGHLSASGWQVEPSDPLRLTLRMPDGLTGQELAQRLRREGVECEYADRDFLVLMASPENTLQDRARLLSALGSNTAPPSREGPLSPAGGERAASIRQALMAPRERVPVDRALGRVCGAPTVSCPPAVPIAVSGERIGPAEMALFARYGVTEVEVLRQ